jgi:hypothetical protein
MIAIYYGHLVIRGIKYIVTNGVFNYEVNIQNFALLKKYIEPEFYSKFETFVMSNKMNDYAGNEYKLIDGFKNKDAQSSYITDGIPLTFKIHEVHTQVICEFPRLYEENLADGTQKRKLLLQNRKLSAEIRKLYKISNQIEAKTNFINHAQTIVVSERGAADNLIAMSDHGIDGKIYVMNHLQGRIGSEFEEKTHDKCEE